MYLDKLKKELKTVQESINHNKTYPEINGISDIWCEYMIVLKNGTAICLNMETVFFPKFNFNEILLIVKRDWSYFEDDGEHFFDSEIGDYVAITQNLYGIEIKNKIYTYEED